MHCGICLPVRILFSTLLLLATAISLHAQKQDRTLEERLTKPDMTLEFNPNQHAVGSVRTYGTGGAQTKDFNFEQKIKPTAYNTGQFWGAKAASAGERQFSTAPANTKSNYSIPNAEKAAATKTAATKDAPDGSKVAATREVWDATRPFLGPESKNLSKTVDQTKDYGWKGDLQPLSIDDIRTLLNKNK
jgi:hypothetical protein